MIEVRLTLEQWQQVLGILAQAPWATANPLIMAVGEQLRVQAPKPNGVGEPNVVQEPPTRQ
jgi:hypothetical protein